MESVANGGIADDLALRICSIGEPEAGLGHELQYPVVDQEHVAAFGERLAVEVGLDLLFGAHGLKCNRVAAVGGNPVGC